MKYTIFENQSEWQNANTSDRLTTFISYAEDLDLDVAQFENDFASSAVSQKISFDQALGSKEGVDSTPSFFLNGERLPDEASAGILQGDLTAIEALLDEKLEQQ